MQYGEIAESKRVNAAIYRCFSYLDENEVRKLVRKFRDQPHDQSRAQVGVSRAVSASFGLAWTAVARAVGLSKRSLREK